MPVLAMQKINLVGRRQDKEAILNCLQKHALVDIQEATAQAHQTLSPETIGQAEFDLAEIKSAINFLESLAGVKKSFIESFVPPRMEVREEEFFTACQDFNCAEMIAQCEGIENKLANLKNLKMALATEIEKLTPWKKLHLPLDQLVCTQKTCNLFGILPRRDRPQFTIEIEKIGSWIELMTISQTREKDFILILYLASKSQRLNELLAKTNFNPVVLPRSQRTPEQEIKYLHSQLQTVAAEEKETLLEAKKLLQHLPRLKLKYDLILDQKQQAEIKQKLIDTRFTFVIEGWIKKEESNKLKNELIKTHKIFEIYEVAAGAKESPPIALKNHAFISPFELITRIYALPKPGEFDPTFFLSFFFALFFGICLGDFGYGLALTLIAFYFLKRYKLPTGGKNLFILLVAGGFTSMAAGILTGSYFGYTPLEVGNLFPVMKYYLVLLQVIDPIKDPLKMLVLSLALGLAQIFFGMFLSLFQKIKNQQYLSAVIDDAFWIFFLASLLWLLVGSLLALPTVNLARVSSLVGTGLLILTQGRHQKNIFNKFISGLLSLYRVSSYLGDILSYSRLLALGMTSAIIGSVINILAAMVKEVPFIGIGLMILILVLGHFFNLVISSLGAFVHSLRLQLVEFFGKFYEGGGREFRPYKRIGEYTVLKGG